MNVRNVQDYLTRAVEHCNLPAENIEIAFRVTEADGRHKCVYPNVCEVYTKDRLVLFFLEGNIVEIFPTNSSEMLNEDSL